MITYVPKWARPPLCSISTLPDELSQQARQKYRGRQIERFMEQLGWRTICMVYQKIPDERSGNLGRFVSLRKPWWVDYEALLTDGEIQEVWLAGIKIGAKKQIDPVSASRILGELHETWLHQSPVAHERQSLQRLVFAGIPHLFVVPTAGLIESQYILEAR
jgi:hypothetical protein